MKAVIYGAGNIGRGFIGQLLSQSDYEVVFIDINQEIINRLNKDKQYPVIIVSDEGEKEIIVKNVRGVNGKNNEDVIKEITTADIMATSVGANVIKFIAKNVATAIDNRISENVPPLNIMLCENLNYADKVFKDELFKYLNENSKKQFEKNVGLVEASIGRMVPVLNKTEENPLKVYVEEFDILHLDKAGFCGDLPKIKNVVAFSPFKYFMQRKLFIHNMCHAISAYLGFIKGYEYISQAISDTEIKYLVNMAGINSAKAIAKDNNENIDLLIDFLQKLIFRFNNAALKDTVKRVGRDPLRKLKSDDRLIGAYKLAKKHNTGYIYILCGIAAAMCFDNKEDTASATLMENVNNKGIINALEDVCGKNIVEENDKQNIIKMYKYIKSGNLKELISFCEKFQANTIKNY